MSSEKRNVAAVANEEKSPRNPASSVSLGNVAVTTSLNGNTTR